MREVAPLAGVRVLEVSDRIGAYCTKLLADLGADVVVVELPTAADSPERSYYHRNKRAVTLDWRRDEATTLLGALAASAAVIVASPRGGRHRLAGYEDDPPRLSWAPPEAITCFITPFGLTGPYRHWRATPFTSFAAGGAMHAVGPVEGPPVAMPGRSLWDEAGVWAASWVQAVLRSSPRPAEPVLDLAVHEVALFKQLGQEPYVAGGRVKTRETNFAAPPSGIWQCCNGAVDIAVHTPGHWEIFLEVTGRPEVLTDPIYRDRRMRVEVFDLLTEQIAGMLAGVDARRFVEVGQAAGLPCTLSQDAAEFTRAPQPRCREYFGAEGGADAELPSRPFRSQPELISYRRPAPAPGEGNEDVYLSELGYSPGQLESWRVDRLV
jgi:crotonobetainyl-CoA:carnitine CoA-transferase CaiB-like acyl-CoA transferase